MSRIFSLSLSVNHLFVSLGLAFVFGLSFRLGFRVTVYVFLRRRVKGTLTVRYCPYFLPEVKFTRMAKGHFVTLI